jgi:transcriptional regulator with XRE-family HTH domain
MPKKRGHYLREWRQSKDLSLEQVAERIVILSQAKAAADPEARAMSMTHATLSRIEREKLPYNQHLMELLAEIYQTEMTNLIRVDPSHEDPIYSLWETLKPVQRQQAVEIIRALKRTGTDD